MMKASKYCTLRSRGNDLLVRSLMFLYHAAEARPFLRLMSLSVSSFEPSRMVFFHVLSPLLLIENFSHLSLFSVRLCSLR